MTKALVALAALLLAGCIDTRTAPVEYGAQVDPSAILQALNTPTQNMHATDIQVGEFVALRTTQDLALGASFAVVGDTGATITAKNEDSDRVVYSGVLHDLTYQQDGTYTKVSREGEIFCASKTPCSCGECGDQTAAESKPALATEPLAPSMQKPTVVTKSRTARSAAASSLSYTSPDKLMTQAVGTAAAAAAPTYHRFSTWMSKEAPPANVRAEPNCLGIANCLIDVYHVVFDEVFWDEPHGNKYHIEARISPSVPYLSRNLSTCQSVLVNIGTSGSNILLKQCTDVFDFRFRQ